MPESEFLDKRTVDNITLSYSSNGIMYVHVADYKEIKSQVEVIKLTSKTIGQITKGKKVPVLVEYSDLVLPDSESREYWAIKDSSPFALAEAYVMHSLALRMIGNFYMRMNKPNRPTKIFADKDLATIWLKTFIEK